MLSRKCGRSFLIDSCGNISMKSYIIAAAISLASAAAVKWLLSRDKDCIVADNDSDTEILLARLVQVEDSLKKDNEATREMIYKLREEVAAINRELGNLIKILSAATAADNMHDSFCFTETDKLTESHTYEIVEQTRGALA